MFNKELEAGMLALNVQMDGITSNIEMIIQNMQGTPDLIRKLDTMESALQDIQSKLAELTTEQKPTESPFLTKEGLFNYKHRKPMPKEE